MVTLPGKLFVLPLIIGNLVQTVASELTGNSAL